MQELKEDSQTYGCRQLICIKWIPDTALEKPNAWLIAALPMFSERERAFNLV